MHTKYASLPSPHASMPHFIVFSNSIKVIWRQPRLNWFWFSSALWNLEAEDCENEKLHRERFPCCFAQVKTCPYYTELACLSLSMQNLEGDMIIVFSLRDIKEIWQALYQKGLGILQWSFLHQLQQRNVWSIQNQF